MPVKYTIEGNFIRKEEVISSEVGLVSDLLPRLTKYMPVELSPLPHGTRYIANEPRGNNGQRLWLIVERPPTLQRILYKNVPASVTEDAISYRLNLPWQFFWFVLDATVMTTRNEDQVIWSPQTWGVFWSKTPFESLETEVTWAHMPNCWQNGTICFGSTNVRANESIGHFIDAAINTFYTSEFNKDLDYPWPHRNMREWERAAEADPEGWVNWDLWTHSRLAPIQQFLNNVTEPGMQFRPAVPAAPDSTPIPEMPRFLTFDNLDEWVSNLDTSAKARLAEVLNGNA